MRDCVWLSRKRYRIPILLFAPCEFCSIIVGGHHKFVSLMSNLRPVQSSSQYNLFEDQQVTEPKLKLRSIH